MHVCQQRSYEEEEEFLNGVCQTAPYQVAIMYDNNKMTKLDYI